MSPELEQYILAHISKEPEELRLLERATNLRLVNGRMCSGHLQGRLLKMLVGMLRPERVLELGTFSGYSALCIAEALEGDATLDTIEADDELEDFIKDAIATSPHGHRITLHIGDAVEQMRTFDAERFDLIFIDADKRQYPAYYEESMRILKTGGYIIADNTLWDGHVTDARRRERDRQTEGVCEFNDMVAADSRVEKVIVPMRDGLTLIRKLKER
ncbi:MAG: O-methyltransferase [Candidatus Amulumruptor caecigallinarius]|nr:O-methyltransferase [Candidatus Amulumruptor caecigallinarius]